MLDPITSPAVHVQGTYLFITKEAALKMQVYLVFPRIYTIYLDIGASVFFCYHGAISSIYHTVLPSKTVCVIVYK